MMWSMASQFRKNRDASFKAPYREFGFVVLATFTENARHASGLMTE